MEHKRGLRQGICAAVLLTGGLALCCLPERHEAGTVFAMLGLLSDVWMYVGILMMHSAAVLLGVTAFQHRRRIPAALFTGAALGMTLLWGVNMWYHVTRTPSVRMEKTDFVSPEGSRRLYRLYREYPGDTPCDEYYLRTGLTAYRYLRSTDAGVLPEVTWQPDGVTFNGFFCTYEGA